MVKNQRQGVLLLGATVFFWFSQYVHVPYQAPYLNMIQVSAGTIGMIVSAYGTTQALCRIPIGFMADMKGKLRLFILLGTSASFLASGTRWLFPNGTGYLCANLLSGLASACWTCFIVMYTNMRPAAELRAATGRILAVNNFGILSGFVAGMLLFDRFGMSAICLSGTALASISVILAFFLKEEDSQLTAPTKAEALSVFSNRQAIVFSLIALVQQGIVTSTANSFTSQAARNAGANGLEIALCSIIYILSAVISANFNGSRRAAKIPASLLIFFLFALLGLYCFLIPNLTKVFWFFPVQILAGLSQGWLYGRATSGAMENIAPNIHSSVMGFYAAIYAIGMVFMPALTGNLIQSISLEAAFYALSAICLFSGGVFGFLIHKLKI